MMCETGTIDLPDLPEHITTPECQSKMNDADLLPMAEVHKRHALRVLAAVHGNKAEAARILGIHRATLYRLVGELDPSEANAANA